MKRLLLTVKYWLNTKILYKSDRKLSLLYNLLYRLKLAELDNKEKLLQDGLCVLITHYPYFNYDDGMFLIKTMRKYKPATDTTYLGSDTYYFTPHKLQPRINFIKYIIKQVKNNKYEPYRCSQAEIVDNLAKLKSE
jgi:hypothetical protein